MILMVLVIGNFSQHYSTSLNASIKIVYIYLSIYQISDSLQGYHEKRLLNNLLNNYNLLERPVANESDPLQVRFGLTLQQIIDVVSTPCTKILLHFLYIKFI